MMIDIETIPNQKAEAMVAAREYTAPANYKDPEKITSNISEQRRKDIERAALHWTTGQIVCISCVSEFTPAVVWSGLDERKVIFGFFEYLQSCNGYYPCGKSFKNFDLPFIVGRAMVHKLAIPGKLKINNVIADIDDIFGVSARSNQHASLADYAFALDIPGKLDGLDGSNVAELVSTGKWGLLEKYCIRDSEIANEILNRYLV